MASDVLHSIQATLTWAKKKIKETAEKDKKNPKEMDPFTLKTIKLTISLILLGRDKLILQRKKDMKILFHIDQSDKTYSQRFKAFPDLT